MSPGLALYSFITLLIAGATASALVLWATAVSATWEMRHNAAAADLTFGFADLEGAAWPGASSRSMLLKYALPLLVLCAATWLLLHMAARHMLLYTLGLTSRQKDQICDSMVHLLLRGCCVPCAAAVAGLMPQALGDACAYWLRRAHTVGDGAATCDLRPARSWPEAEPARPGHRS